jgi:hypothetical protein
MSRPADVISITHDDHPALARTLERALIEERDNHIEGLTSAKDWADFQKRNGRIEGLNLAISYCQNVRKALEA